MKNIYFDNQDFGNAAQWNGAHIANNANINFAAGGGVVNFGNAINVGAVNAGAIVIIPNNNFNIVNAKMIGLNFGGGVGANGNNMLVVDPILENATTIIRNNNPEVTTLDLSSTNFTDWQLNLVCQELPKNNTIEVINFSNNHIGEYGVQEFITSNHNVVSANFTGCLVNSQFDLPILSPVTIYESPFIRCIVSESNVLASREKDAQLIVKDLYKIIEFGINSIKECQKLIKFVSSPNAKKALKFLTENSCLTDTKFIGESFIKKLGKVANENIFYLKAVYKKFDEGDSFNSLPLEVIFKIFSYLNQSVLF